MAETYKFFVQMDGQVFGPYTALEVKNLDLLGDIMVTEESMNGQWLPAAKFDFDDMVKKEAGMGYSPSQTASTATNAYPQYSSQSSAYTVNQDGSVTAHTSTKETPYNPDEVPAEIRKWNWGAFFFHWLWGVFNGVYWPLCLILVQFIPYVGTIVCFGICITLGINGNEWAWKGKRWKSVEEFKRVQHNWAMAVVWLFAASFVLGAIIAYFIVSMSQAR